jgi:transposase
MLICWRSPKSFRIATYLHNLSPIELLWSKVKEFLRSAKPRTHEELDNAITEAFKTVKKKIF